MNVERSVRRSAPLFHDSEQQAAKMRKRLEEVFRNLSLAPDVLGVCIELSERNSGDFNT